MQGKNSTETTVTILSDFPVRSEILVENFMTELILCRFHYAGINPIWAGGAITAPSAVNCGTPAGINSQVLID